MNHSFDKSTLFMEPNTTQYGSHMVMTNVVKPKKTKYLNIDTRFRDEYNYNDKSYFNTTFPDKYKYNITLPENINNVFSVMVRNIEIPMTFYNISNNFENNYFNIKIAGSSDASYNKITLPDGNYNVSNIITQIDASLSALYANDISFVYTNGYCNLNSTTKSYTINYASNDKYNFKSSLGWLLGYRNPIYTITNNIKTVPENPSNLNIPQPRYLYLAIDEFNKGVQNSVITPVSNAFLNKNVIARISLNPTMYGYGSVLPANLMNGLLVSDVRSYNGTANLQRFNIQLLNENGMPVDLNGQDFSFCLEIQHE